jgi:hypothetical protein
MPGGYDAEATDLLAAPRIAREAQPQRLGFVVPESVVGLVHHLANL